MKILYAILITLICSTAWAKYEAGTNDAASVVLYGKQTNGTLTALKVDSTGSVISGSLPDITDTGSNVGIGSASPGQKLDIVGTIRNINGDLIVNNGNVGIGTNLEIAGLAIMNGNVGIGTWVPAAPFEMVNTGTAGLGVIANFIQKDNNQARIRVTNNNGAAQYYVDANGNPHVYSASSNKDIIFETTAGIEMTLKNNGNVGIGTILPPQVLYVAGSGQFTTGVYMLSAASGNMVCTTTSGQLGHCTGSASCLSTCTCTCTAN